MGATSLAILTAATANSAAALAAAESAKRTACAGLVKGYQHDGATVSEIRAYSECVGRLYPDPLTAGELQIAKASVALLLIAMVIGAYYGACRFDDRGPLASVMFALFFPCSLIAGIAVLAIVALGVRFLFS